MNPDLIKYEPNIYNITECPTLRRNPPAPGAKVIKPLKVTPIHAHRPKSDLLPEKVDMPLTKEAKCFISLFPYVFHFILIL